MRRIERWTTLLAVAGSLLVPTASRGQVFFYDGELFERDVAVSGVFDFRFTRYAAPDGEPGDQIGEPVELDGVEVRDGRFSVALDFGEEEPSIESRWLAIEVARAERGATFTRLEPLQRLGAAAREAPEDNFPSGTVAYFDLAACPTGWSELVDARGRVLVGLQPGGTLRGTQGTALADLEARTHHHTVSVSTQTAQGGAHRHQWSSLADFGSGPEWRSYDLNGSPIVVFQWTNGIDDAGSGIYPLTASPTPGKSFYTATSSDHVHSVSLSAVPTASAAGGLPYLQLLICRKG